MNTLYKIGLVIFFFLFSFYYLKAQISTGITASFISNKPCYEKISWRGNLESNCDNEKIKELNFDELIDLEIYNPGFGISYYIKSDVINVFDKFNIGIGASIGYEFIHYKNVSYNLGIVNGKPDKYNNIGLNYITNDFFINLKSFGWLYLETGLQNRFLVYRHYEKEYRNFKEMKSKHPIPFYYNDFYFSFGIEIKGFLLKIKTTKFIKNILIENVNTGLHGFEPYIYKLAKVRELSLSIPIKSFDTEKLPLYKF
jgi:hypothetical protein